MSEANVQKSVMTLEELMKSFENKDTIDPQKPFVIRLDGRTFSKYTRKNCVKPFDTRLDVTFRELTIALCKEFRPQFAYTQSDEISLIFLPKENPESQPPFGGKMQKLASVTAGFASACLVKVLMKNELGTESIPHLDSRVFNLPDEEHVRKYAYWRYRDWIRNSISRLAQYYFSAKQLNNKKAEEQKKMLFDEHGVSWDYYPEVFKYGTFVIKEQQEVVPGTMRNKYVEKVVNEDDLHEFVVSSIKN